MWCLGRPWPSEAPHQGLVWWPLLPERDPAEPGADVDARSLVLCRGSGQRSATGGDPAHRPALGVEGVLLPQRRSAELGGACAKTASGALDLLPIVEVVDPPPRRSPTEAARLLDRRPRRGGRDAARTLELPHRVVLVLGSEGEGLRRLVAEEGDHLARLEIDPRMESLNVSVAAGIALYLAARR